jgi:hypothetical protein
MPTELQPIMEQACPEGRKTILDRVYAGGVPAAYLASFAGLFSEQKNHPFVKGLVRECFSEFLTRHVCKYQDHERLPVHFVGSVAFHFQDSLRETLHGLGLRAGIILKKPISNLVAFHLDAFANNKT